MIIQVYIPTTNAEEVDKFHDEVQFEIYRTCKQMCWLWLDTGMPKLEILRREKVLGLYDINENEARKQLMFMPVQWFLSNS